MHESADGGRHAARILTAAAGDRGKIVMCIRTRTASKISNPGPELLAARAGPLGRDGRVAAAQFRGGAGLASAQMCRRTGGNVGVALPTAAYGMP